MLTLCALERQKITCRWRLSPSRPSLLIGRSPLADVWLKHPSISRHHARLERSDEGAWTISDLNTTNGVHVNGVRAPRSLLVAGDTLQCGSVDLRLDAVPPIASASAGIEALRDRINRGPSAAGWAAICAILEAWPDDTLDVGLDYARDHTARWPLTLCGAPDGWLDALILGIRQSLTASRRRAAGPAPLSPELGQVLPALTLSPPILLGPEDPRWALARSLVITDVPFEEDVRDALVQSPRLDRIERLTIRHSGASRAFIKALAEGRPRPALRSLDVTACGLNADEVKALVQSPAFEAVTDLTLDGNRLGRLGALPVAERLGRFDRLSMRDTGLGDPSAEALTEALSGARLQSLDIGWNPISHLARGPLERASPGHIWLGNLGLDHVPVALPSLPTDPRLFKKALKKARLRHGANLVGLLTLVPVDGDLPIAVHPLRDDEDLVIGRSQEADIVIRNPTLSRRHARLAVRRDDKGEVIIKCGDFESTGGIWNEASERFSIDTLRPGERLRLGDFWLSVRPLEPLPAKATPAQEPTS